MFLHHKKSDNYATRPEEWKKIKHLIPLGKRIWCPFYADGAMKEYFADMGFDIYHEDEDFFLNDHGDIVIDNPPFSKYREICDRLKKLDKPFILLGQYRTLSTKWFQDAFKDDLQLVIPSSRIRFYHMTDEQRSRYTPPFGSLFYCWKIGLPRDLNWV